MKENTTKKIAEIQRRVNEVVTDHTIKLREKGRILGDIYLDARDYKSDGNLSGESIRDVMDYDERAIGYVLYRLEQQRTAEGLLNFLNEGK